MKKEYIKPAINIEEVTVVSMLAASSDTVPVDPNPAEPAAKERRSSWGSLWD